MERKDFLLKRDVFVEWELLSSTAFRSLSKTGILVLLRFYQKRRWEKKKGSRKAVYTNNGITFSYREAFALGIKSPSTFNATLAKLIEAGLLDIERQGGLHQPSVYALSSRWRLYDMPGFAKVAKPRVLWKGHDVRTWVAKKCATKNRSEPLRETVAAGEK